MAIATLSALLLASAPLAATDRIALDRAMAEIFAPYRGGQSSVASWQRPIFSRRVRELIAHWEKVQPEGEVDDLNDGDWLCQCQDWDEKAFRYRIISRKPTSADEVVIGVSISLGHGQTRDAWFAMRREGGRWLIDDLYSEDHSDGIRQALVETIAADEALLK